MEDVFLQNSEVIVERGDDHQRAVVVLWGKYPVRSNGVFEVASVANL